MTLDTAGAAVSMDRVRGGVHPLFSGRASGRLTLQGPTPILDFSIHVPSTPVAPLFRKLVSEPYKYRHPFLETLEIDGSVSGNVKLRKDPTGWSLRGRALCEDGHFSRMEKGISFSGISAVLPILYGTGKATDAGRPAAGRLRIRQMALPAVPQQELDLRFDVYPDHSAILSPAAVELATGRAAFGPIKIENLFSENIQLRTRLRLQSIAIDPFLKGIWPKPTGGVLHGQLSRVRFDGNHLTSKGDMVIDVFGGELRLRDPGVKKLLSRAPTWVLDARIVELDLGRLTEDTAFGRIHGILQGWIDNLEIVHGQTQRFDLHLETVKTEDVPQKINVEAVTNIARLGGGRNPFMGLAGKVVAVFDEFFYRKMGVKATLANDMFKINGTIHADGKEYLVKKGGIPGVDVVNLNPDNRISFKDMLNRIRRIEGRRGGPVIR
jgi:hypothetical protein